MTIYEIESEISEEIKTFYKANKKSLKRETGSGNPNIWEKAPSFVKAVKDIKSKYQAQIDEILIAEAKKAEAQRAEAQLEASKSLSELSKIDINNIQEEIEYAYNGLYSEALKCARNLGYTGLNCNNSQLVACIEKLSNWETLENYRVKAEMTQSLTETFTINGD